MPHAPNHGDTHRRTHGPHENRRKGGGSGPPPNRSCNREYQYRTARHLFAHIALVGEPGERIWGKQSGHLLFISHISAARGFPPIAPTALRMIAVAAGGGVPHDHCLRNPRVVVWNGIVALKFRSQHIRRGASPSSRDCACTQNHPQPGMV